ncbi:hypothetical protein Cantr_02869 [Candida viswanathii]|uniref:Uncharacterized protein n=1 Tax=Candida viswanathii TaxID=5486 RepID=A0A367YQZ5_9ASCO|nr:hypothetical protein Cantr_02869 [Candida viswanathii]
MTDISNTTLFILLVITLVFVVVIFLIVFFCFPCCCRSFMFSRTKRRRLRMAITEFFEEQLDENKQPINQMDDLENQAGAQDPQNNADAASNVALNSFPMNSTNSTKPPPPSEVAGGAASGAGAAPAATEGTHSSDPTQQQQQPTAGAAEGAVPSAFNDTRDLDFKSVLEEYLEDNSGEEPVVQTIVANPSDPFNDIVTRYDTYSRTVLLQLITEASRKPNEQMIREVSDPFLEKFISIGEKVVVVKPFIGKNDREFPLLQTGDLLRIIKFSIVDATDSDATGSIKSIHIGSAKAKCKAAEAKNELEGQTEYQAEEITIDRTDPNHGRIICTGILLDTYLDFNSHNNELKLKIKDEQENEEPNDTESIPFELIKEFPLSIVSLETTVVKTALYGDGANSEAEY